MGNRAPSAGAGTRIPVDRISWISAQPIQIKMRLGLVIVARVEAETLGRPKGAMIVIRDEQTAARPAMGRRADMGVTKYVAA
jgi:hypothetical protein